MAGESILSGPETPASAVWKSKAPQEASSSNQKRLKHEIYALPIPIRTFPLPAFYPQNPMSWIHLAWVWIRQTVLPPREPLVVYEGVWDAASRSVHVTDEKSIRGLWERGFFGKGTLSRSEPNWKARELNRAGKGERRVVEQVTVSRREERQRMKWERAKCELEAIEQTRLREGSVASLQSQKPPVGPLELLALPNSLAEIVAESLVVERNLNGTGNGQVPPTLPPLSNENPLSFLMNGTETEVGQDLPSLRLVNSDEPTDEGRCNGHDRLGPKGLPNTANGNVSSPPQPQATWGPPSPGQTETGQGSGTLKRQKSVRFSPKVESTVFQRFDPPSPSETLKSGQIWEAVDGNANGAAKPPRQSDSAHHGGQVTVSPAGDQSDGILEKEHLQLSMEEAFFLQFGLGVLSVVDPGTKRPIPTPELLRLFRCNSYFPQKPLASSSSLRPDDPFLIHYVVYHQFRSLGWVVRHGIKFGTDWMLYQKGPVFDHAEFGMLVMPSYGDAQWRGFEYERPALPWSWLMGTVRVLSHALKSLVLVYVDIPSPALFDSALGDPQGGIEAALKLYKIKTINVRRWSSNRNR